jgi:DNA modification methylase
MNQLSQNPVEGCDAELVSRLQVRNVQVNALVPYQRNARTHTNHQIRQIAKSIQEFGFTNPLLIDATNTIIAGHGRIAAAKLLGMQEVPTIRLDELTPDQVRAYVLADNKLAENAGWDKSILAIELQHLLSLESIDVTVSGFEVPEIDVIIGEVKSAEEKEEVTLPTGPAVAQPGDLWFLGNHRIFCGNSLEQSSYESLMGSYRAAMVFTDAPYNVRVDGNVCGKGSIHHREFEMASGEMTEAEFIAFLSRAAELLAKYSTEGSVHYQCMDWRHAKEMLAAGERVYDSLLNVCVWVKDNGGMGSFYRSQHELVFVFRNGKQTHRNNIQLGRFGRFRTNVWKYPGVNTMSKQGEEGNLLALHPTVKPVKLVADAILDCSARGEIVLDAFLGSGTTLLAAERVGRICRGIEIDPVYVDVAIRRWQQLTGDRAIHATSGKSFDELAEAGGKQ